MKSSNEMFRLFYCRMCDPFRQIRYYDFICVHLVFVRPHFETTTDKRHFRYVIIYGLNFSATRFVKRISTRLYSRRMVRNNEIKFLDFT